MSRNATAEDLVARKWSTVQATEKRYHHFGDVLKYGTPRRLGANEARDWIFKDVNIQNHSAQLRYVLYCIPYEDEMDNSAEQTTRTSGDWKIDSTKDADRFTVPIDKTKYPFEAFYHGFSEGRKRYATGK